MSDQIYEAQALEIAKLAADLKSTKAENEKLRELLHLKEMRQKVVSEYLCKSICLCEDLPCIECPAKEECDRECELTDELGV